GEPINTTTLTQSAGTLQGSDVVTVSGPITWTGGTMNGSGATLANGGLLLGGSNVKDLGDTRVFNNAGLATWTNQQIRFFNTATFNNQIGASFTIQGDGLILANFANGVFNNSGTLTNTPGTNTVQTA